MRLQLVAIFQLIAVVAFAQPDPSREYNENSLRPIRQSDQMFKKSLWFRMDLRTKKNAGFFAKNNEISRLIIDGVQKGLITPYLNDSLTTPLTREEFQQNMRKSQVELEQELFNLYGTSDEAWGAQVAKRNKAEPVSNEYFPKDLYVLELRQDMIFDSRRSRMYRDTQAITLILPAAANPLGVDKVIASFSYKDLYNNLFHTKTEDGRTIDNPEAIYYNMNNSAAHLNLGDAFDMEMYEAMLMKYENPRDNSLVDLYGAGRKGAYMSQEAVFKLIEYEALLWSY